LKLKGDDEPLPCMHVLNTAPSLPHLFPTGKKPLKLKGETEAHTDADPNKKAPSLMKQVRATERR
jgi:hypothetical protein